MHRRMLFSIISGNNLIKTQLLLIVDLISASFVDQSSRFFLFIGAYEENFYNPKGHGIYLTKVQINMCMFSFRMSLFLTM